MLSSRRTETRLRDCTSASRRRIGPRKPPPSFCGCQVLPRRSRNTTGASSTIEAGLKPLSNAAAYTNGLKLEPGWRRAWVARLNLLPAKLKPPTSARNAPVSASSETSDAWPRGIWSISHSPSLLPARTRIMSPRVRSLAGERLVQRLAATGSTSSLRSASTTVTLPSACVAETTAGCSPDCAGMLTMCRASAVASASAVTSKCCSTPCQPWRWSYSSRPSRMAVVAASCRGPLMVVVTW
ncbi:hypothetical protein D3C81_1049220 [compost metagenome]